MRTIKSTVTAAAGQTWSDVSILATGTADYAFAIALANGLSVTDKLVSGSSIHIPEGLEIQSRDLQFYQARNLAPATGVTLAEMPLLDTDPGIGEMIIGTSFIVR